MCYTERMDTRAGAPATTEVLGRKNTMGQFDQHNKDKRIPAVLSGLHTARTCQSGETARAE